MPRPVTTAAIAALRDRIQQLEGPTDRPGATGPAIRRCRDRQPTAGGGLALAALHEVAGGGNGAIDGAAAALFAAAIAARSKGQVLWCVTRPDLFAPALAQVGLLPGRVIYVEAGDEQSLL